MIEHYVPSEHISQLWACVAQARQARGDSTGARWARYAAYGTRLGRAVMHNDQATRVAAINRLANPFEGRERVMATAAKKSAGNGKSNGSSKSVTFTLDLAGFTKNTGKYVDGGAGVIVGPFYLRKDAAKSLGSMPDVIAVTITSA